MTQNETQINAQQKVEPGLPFWHPDATRNRSALRALGLSLEGEEAIEAGYKRGEHVPQ